jgi:hypothetical protein
VHVAPAYAGSMEGSDHFGSYIRSLSLHFYKRLFPGLEQVYQYIFSKKKHLVALIYRPSCGHHSLTAQITILYKPSQPSGRLRSDICSSFNILSRARIFFCYPLHSLRLLKTYSLACIPNCRAISRTSWTSFGKLTERSKSKAELVS